MAKVDGLGKSPSIIGIGYLAKNELGTVIPSIIQERNIIQERTIRGKNHERNSNNQHEEDRRAASSAS